MKQITLETKLPVNTFKKNRFGKEISVNMEKPIHQMNELEVNTSIQSTQDKEVKEVLQQHLHWLRNSNLDRSDYFYKRSVQKYQRIEKKATKLFNAIFPQLNLY